MGIRGEGVVLGLAVFVSAAIGQISDETSTACSPPCRSGYVCHDGRCISACNPPCPLGYRCDPDVLDCVPIPKPAPAPAPVPAPWSQPATTRAKTRGYCESDAVCAPGYICFDGECERESYVASAGNVAFNSTQVPYGIGTLYSSVSPIIWAFAGYYEYCDDYYTYGGYYETDCYHGYDEEEAILSLAPQSGMYVLFGTLNRIATSKQARYLGTLGADGSGGLLALSWILHGASMTTTALNVFSFATEDQEFVTTTAFINAAVVLSSFVVNTVCYGRQAKQLDRAVAGRHDGRHSEDTRLRLLPYVHAGKDGGGAGIALAF